MQKLLLYEACFQVPLRSVAAIVDSYKNSIFCSRSDDMQFSLASLSRVVGLISVNSVYTSSLVDVVNCFIEMLNPFLPALTSTPPLQTVRQQKYALTSTGRNVLQGNIFALVGHLLFFSGSQNIKSNDAQIFSLGLKDNLQRFLFLESIVKCLANETNDVNIHFASNMILQIGFPLALKITQSWLENISLVGKQLRVFAELIRLSIRYTIDQKK